MWWDASSVVNPIFGTANSSCTLFPVITCVEIVRTVSFYQAPFQVLFHVDTYQSTCKKNLKGAMIKSALSAIGSIRWRERRAWTLKSLGRVPSWVCQCRVRREPLRFCGFVKDKKLRYCHTCIRGGARPPQSHSEKHSSRDRERGANFFFDGSVTFLWHSSSNFPNRTPKTYATY